MIFRFILLLVCWVAISLRTYGEYEYRQEADTAKVNDILRMAIRYVETEKYDSAYDIFQVSFRISRQIRYQHGIIRSLNGLGNIEARSGHFHRSLYFLEHAVRFAVQMPDSGIVLPYVYNNLAATYTDWGDIEQGLRYYKLSLEMHERHPLSRLPADAVYINIGHLLNESGRHREALFYLERAGRGAGSAKDGAFKSLLYTHIGKAFMGQQIWDSAAFYFRKALAGNAAVPVPAVTQSLALQGLANLALRQHQPELAIHYLKKAIASNRLPGPAAPHEAAISLGRAYILAGNQPLALHYLHNALEESVHTGLQPQRMEAHRVLSGLYAARSDFRSAYYHERSAAALADSIHTEKRTRTSMHLESRLRSAVKDSDLKEKQLVIELKEREIQIRNIWIGIIAAGLAMVSSLVFLLRRNYRNRQRLKDAGVSQLLRKQELREFRSIIDAEEKERNRIGRDLHDGVMIQFSVVKMNLSALAGSEDMYITKAQLMPCIRQLNAATQSLRNAAHHLMPDMLLEGGLTEALYYFCKSLQPDVPFRIRYEQLDEIPRFDLQTEIAIYRIVQELIQNIVKHAQATCAFIQISYNDQCLGIEVEDDGQGMGEGASLRGGVGLKTIETRIRRLNGIMSLSTGSMGTSISLEFNLEERAALPAGHPANEIT